MNREPRLLELFSRQTDDIQANLWLYKYGPRDFEFCAVSSDSDGSEQSFHLGLSLDELRELAEGILRNCIYLEPYRSNLAGE